MEVSGQLHAPAALPPRERAPGTYWIEGWVGPRASLDTYRLWDCGLHSSGSGSHPVGSSCEHNEPPGLLKKWGICWPVEKFNSCRVTCSRSGHLTPGERYCGSHWKWSCMHPKANLDLVAREKFSKLCGLEPWSSTLRQSLYWVKWWK
jgi:hypothetical protein